MEESCGGVDLRWWGRDIADRSVNPGGGIFGFYYSFLFKIYSYPPCITIAQSSIPLSVTLSSVKFFFNTKSDDSCHGAQSDNCMKQFDN
jgi:hypothetical protein